MRFIGVAVLAAFLCYGAAAAETWRLAEDQQWQPVSSDPHEQYLHALAELNGLVRKGETKRVKKALKALQEQFPTRVGPDLDPFVAAELKYWKNRYEEAVPKYEKLLKGYPSSEYATIALEREFDIAKAYLDGRKKTVLGVLKLSGKAEAIEIMERISDRAGLQEPNSVGLKAAVEVAEHYERHKEYLEAYMKWSEIASYWEKGAIGKKAMYRMAENNLAAYDQNPPARRAFFDASKLTTAKTYYEKYSALYPQDANDLEIPQKIRQIDEKMAYKHFATGQYYRRVGKEQAARLYFDGVARNWPKTEAAELARRALDEDTHEERPAGDT